MKKISIGKGEITASEISLGCMRIAKLSDSDASALINTSLENGIDFFDHADIYSSGRSEEVFAKAIGMTPSIREKILIQSKCGIRNPEGYYDSSKEHILEAVEGSLRRLKTDYLDILLLHRPDALVEPEEVAQAFTSLHSSGKVRYFGVSNHNAMQIELLKKYLGQDILINQLQFSIAHTGMIDAGINVNTNFDGSVDHDGSILDYCRLHDITIQAWSPFQYGFFEGVFLGSPKYPELNRIIDDLAGKYGVSNMAIAVAFLLRHPAKMQVIAGTTNPARIASICKAPDVGLTRREWYEIYKAAGNKLP